jgi:2-polyprenyl-6-methoxyphenol hydroxylase-like FAD-dependent oxidoreductase
MSTILVLGGGVIGLSTAMMLAHRGHSVTVFESDSDPIPGSPEKAWQSWERSGVTQFRLPHFLFSPVNHLLDFHLPDVKDALLRAGCITFDRLATMPQSINDRAPREGDERFLTVTGRRPTIEYAVASVAEKQVSVRRGVPVLGLLTGRSTGTGIPNVIGVRTLDGKDVFADLVIDAMGRRSNLPNWLEGIGARRPIEEAADSGFIYYTRFFRSSSGVAPTFRAELLTYFHSFSLLTLPSDARTWSVTVIISTDDPALKRLRNPVQWTALIAACPWHAHWLDGEPITDVLSMAGISDRYRRFVLNGVPVATGIITVGDSWACTNPSLGRGITLGLMHAVGTTEVVQEHLDDPFRLALAHDSMTEKRVTPWYRDTIAIDQNRSAQVKALVEGRSETQQPASPRARIIKALSIAMMYDADIYRAAAEMRSVLALPEEVLARPGMVEHITKLADTHEAINPPAPAREELLRMLA